jgi:hypothetical protein
MQIGEQVRGQVWRQVEMQIEEQVREQMWGQVEMQIGAQEWGQVRRQVGGFCYGQHDAAWLASYDFFLRECGLACCEKLIPLMRVAEHCHWFLPYDKVCICSEKPIVHMQDKRLHRDGGPAVEYRDGFGVWALHGVRVSKEIAETPGEKLDAKLLLTEENSEVRREILRKVGVGALPQKLDARCIDAWREYELYKIEDVDIEPVHILKMQCPSTEAIYAHRVPPDIKKARKAIKWMNNGIDAKEFMAEA